MPTLTVNVLKIFFLSATAVAISALWTPHLINFLYKHKLWRKTARNKSIDGKDADVFYELHKEREVSVPRFGGLLIWITVVVIAFAFFGLSHLFPNSFWLQKLNFFSRSQTWLPMFAFVAAALLGLVDDILQVKGKGKYIAGGISFWRRFAVVALIGLIGGIWFYFKLDARTLHIPGNGDIFIGAFYIALFVIVMLASWAGGVIDGLDGLSGGSFLSMFAAFAIIAFAKGQIDIAAFCVVICGTLLTFLWFNIPPARFYMGETGSVALTSTLAVIAFLTDSVLVLPIIAGLLVWEVGSIIIQLLSKKIRGKKYFLSTPIHHHFEAMGWPHYKVTMRFWVIGIVLALIGVAVRLLG
jgi:phospho-N-acetylmuramoyl-pentapeptide-transferase